MQIILQKGNFLSMIVYKQENKRIQNHIEKKMINKSVSIVNGSWKNFNMKENLLLVDEWKIQSLWIYQNYTSQIMLDIIDLKFPSIKLISLKYDSIKSIELLSRIYMPTLERFKISGNQISMFKTFKKVVWPYLYMFEVGLHLQYVDFKYCWEFQAFQAMYLPSLTSIQCDDISKEKIKTWIIKLETKILNTFHYGKIENLRWNKNYKLQLVKKYLSLDN